MTTSALRVRSRVVWLSACAGALVACSSGAAMLSPDDGGGAGSGSAGTGGEGAGGTAGNGSDAGFDGASAGADGAVDRTEDAADGAASDRTEDAADDAGADAGGSAVVTYIKASNASTQETFGNAVALSGDGSTLAVGAIGQVSVDNGAGTVYVFVHVGGRWSQQALIKPSNTAPGDYFGMSLALSADGSTLAVGAINAGAAYVFTRAADGTWSQQAYIKASNTERDDGFGQSIALSGDGATLAVGAPFEDSSATGIDGNQADDSAPSAGAAYVFTRAAGGAWSQQAYVKPSDTAAQDGFGQSLSLSGDGAVLAVGAPFQGLGVTPPSADPGAVYLFSRASGTWSPQTRVKAPADAGTTQFGLTVALSADGLALAVGAPFESPGAFASGATYVFARGGADWPQQARLEPPSPRDLDHFGIAVSLSADGALLAVGASGDSSRATGLDGDQTDSGAPSSGAVHLFSRTGAGWSPKTYVKATNTDANDAFGNAVALSGNGGTLAVAAWFESSSATGIDGDQTDNSAMAAGAVYIY